MSTAAISHYYGDTVRILFITGGCIMVVAYPFVSSYISIPIPLAIVGFAILAVFGGFMNPKQKWIIVLNTVLAILAFVIFEYTAVATYVSLPSISGAPMVFFWINQALAINFFFAAYLATKSLRGMINNEEEKIEKLEEIQKNEEAETIDELR